MMKLGFIRAAMRAVVRVAMLAAVLALGLALVSCGDGATGSGSSNESNGIVGTWVTQQFGGGTLTFNSNLTFSTTGMQTFNILRSGTYSVSDNTITFRAVGEATPYSVPGLIRGDAIYWGDGIFTRQGSTGGGGGNTSEGGTLEGRWQRTSGGTNYEYTFDKGVWTFSENSIPFDRGNYTTNANQLTLNMTEDYFNETRAYLYNTSVGWKSRSQASELYRQRGWSEERINELFAPRIYTYAVNGGTLVWTNDFGITSTFLRVVTIWER